MMTKFRNNMAHNPNKKYFIQMSCRSLSLSLMILFFWKRENGGNNLSIVKGFSLPSSLSSHRSPSFFLLSSSISSPSEEYSTASDMTELGRDKLQQYFPFPIDDWQALAGGEIYSGRNAIVCAPTGAGKTVVGEMALRLAFENGMNAIYTTPLKALSNQKFAELRKIFGPKNVGLSTGDMSINRGSQITVMTTEVYRNMAWRADGSKNDDNMTGGEEEEGEAFGENELANTSVVVLDEFHYMGQPGRGGVWEECVITSPQHTQIVGLSATLPNADRLVSWIQSVTGRETKLVEAKNGRPVPLRYLFATKEGLDHLFRDPDAGPGAPKGLLGLRGDGIIEFETPRKKKKQSKLDWEDDENNSYPLGLEINPSFRKAADKVLQKVERKVQRKIMEQKMNSSEGSSKRDRWYNERPLSPREQRRMKERLLRQEMKRSVPSIVFVLRGLRQKKLLPAIFFIFSRAKCDEAAEAVCSFMRLQASTSIPTSDISLLRDDDNDDTGEEQLEKNSRGRGRKNKSRVEDVSLLQDTNGRSFRSKSKYIKEETLESIFSREMDFNRDEEFSSPLLKENFDKYAKYGLLNLDEVKEVAARIKHFNKENEEIAFDDATSDRFLYGVGSHHAGQLPAHKAFAEALFRTELMKVVFATETLAAGINMPARTTVICSMAKRSKDSMNLLDTANLLQMAGRAGRRGMDTDGTCVIVATPFEGPEDAVTILTNEIKPVVSQFSPSYSLAVNLIARGAGKLDVARNLVRKSFAMWEKQQLEKSVEKAKSLTGDGFDEVVESATHERFLEILQEELESLMDNSNGKKKKSYEFMIDVITNKKSLKKNSKSYIGLSNIYELEKKTLAYLQEEAATLNCDLSDMDDDTLADLIGHDKDEMQDEIETQQLRVGKTEIALRGHVFTQMCNAANSILQSCNTNGESLRSALQVIRSNDPDTTFPDNVVTPEELTRFAKSVVSMNRQRRKQNSSLKEAGLDSSSLIDQIDIIESTKDDTFEDMLALNKVLEAYGCITKTGDSDADFESSTYLISEAGEQIGLLGFENSLWCMVAMGGAWDVKYASSDLDRFRASMREFDLFSDDGNDLFDDDDDDDFSSLLEKKDTMDTSETREDREYDNGVPKPQIEAGELVSNLLSLEPNELAGYVACLISDSTRGGTSSVIDAFQSLTPSQQRTIQCSLHALERLMEVQKKFNVDESSSNVQLELGTCEVVTAWAGGCTWSEALEMSGTAPGDLARTLNRALDALRQFGNLPFSSIRAMSAESGVTLHTSSGIHPDLRRLCKEAAMDMDRYPLKDPLPMDDMENVDTTNDENYKSEENEDDGDDEERNDDSRLQN